ncbi:hypothetical protein KH5H1_67160 [Corallococcus caeni]|nr:hypothetical protein KH5H1_67160 [Corallococcus sp. KH5-1]
MKATAQKSIAAAPCAMTVPNQRFPSSRWGDLEASVPAGSFVLTGQDSRMPGTGGKHQEAGQSPVPRSGAHRSNHVRALHP